jgi:two-component system OmpR family sensor kinase
MSLRSRLLIAIGVIALVALVIADVATYKSLQSFLYQQVDQQLESSHISIEGALNSGHSLQCYPGDGSPQGGGPGGPGNSSSPYTNAFQELAVEVRSPTGQVSSSGVCAIDEGGTSYTPQLPTTITGYSTESNGERYVYFTAASTQADGPLFRVRACILANGDVLVVAQPLNGPVDTLHRLLLIELAVTGGAIIVALLGGFWLVRLGLRPLRDMETTAEAIAAGNLTERVPGENEATEVGRLARTLNIMLARIESAFGDGSWPTPPTSCAPPSPPSRPMPSCSAAAPRSKRPIWSA